MENFEDLSLKLILKLTKASEKKFREGNFRGAFEDKMEVKSILKSKFCNRKITEKFRKELSKIYYSKFDLIKDHKLKIDLIKIKNIIKLLDKKSEEKFKKGDFKGAVKALRRSEKYLSI